MKFYACDKKYILGSRVFIVSIDHISFVITYLIYMLKLAFPCFKTYSDFVRLGVSSTSILPQGPISIPSKSLKLAKVAHKEGGNFVLWKKQC